MTEQLKKKTLAHWDLINRLAVRRFGTAAIAEEAALFVVDSLAADSWKRVQAHTGKGKFKSFLASLSWRLLEDFSRKRFGRVRPPLWINKLGGIWPVLFSLLCMERLSVADAVENLCTRYPICDPDSIEDAALTLLGRIPQCGKQQGVEFSFEETNVNEQSGNSAYPEHLLEKNEKEHLLAAIFGKVMGEEQLSRVPKTLTTFWEKGVELSPEERLLLKLLYQDNVGVRRAGELLSLNRDQVNGRRRRLLRRLRKDFQGMGLGEELLELMR